MIALMKQITPATLGLPITVEVLENLKFAPCKNYDTNQLEYGALQILDGTLVICDETAMKEGKLTEKGINNIKSLAHLIELQAIHYDFQYSQVEFQSQAQVIILSDGRSMFKNTMHVPLNKENVKEFDAAKFESYLKDEELMTMFRKYILML